MNKQLILIAGLATFTAGAQVIRAQEKAPVELNRTALEFARQLIREGRVVADKKGAWRADKPSTAQENEFVRHHGFEIYGQWHLGVDSHHTTHSKAHYKFPFGDFNALHRCGLLAVKARAREYGYADIEAAADQLLAEIEINRPTR
jgi:hypothetical protein